MTEQHDSEIPDVPEHDLSEEDMAFVSLLYNYILVLEADEREEEQQRQGGLIYQQEGEYHLSEAAGPGDGSLKKEDSNMVITLASWTHNSD
ncbi:hypothetical protein DPMN_167790 [Dreissena polymorpha]|uniref:Uncharacterized protein n=1 Tax=Dreissena polymorpha TaxID=45954 RepID=A0A9D4IWN1_DREPO|nr:hypothetical protein DPMN_167790 [Dreissena polymorpha]